MFLRSGCALPDSVDPISEQFCEDWAHIERIEAAGLDVMVRRAGWHFMWVRRSCSRRGYGLTEVRATHRALARALKGIARRFNAAEFDSVRIVRFPGFYVANVTMEARQIQQNTSLDFAGENPPQATSAR